MTINNGALQRKIRGWLRLFRRAAQKSAGEKSGSEWLTDNFYLLENEARAALKNSRQFMKLPKGTDGLPCLFAVCRELCGDGVLPEAAVTEQFFKSRGISGAEVCALPDMFRVVLLEKAAVGCRAPGREALRVQGNAVRSLRALNLLDTEKIAACGAAEQILLQDPAGIYPALDKRSKGAYRRKLSRLAEKQGKSEAETASECLEKAQKGTDSLTRHIGTYFAENRYHRKWGAALLAAEALIPLAVSVGIAFWLGRWYLPFLLWLPLWEMWRPISDIIGTKTVSPAFLYRLREDDERVRNTRVMIAVSQLLPGAGQSDGLEQKLRQLYRANYMPGLKVCLLADLKGADAPVKPEDEGALRAAVRVIDRLNRCCGGGFVLAVRPRVFSPTQGEFTGKWRKRGAITELVRVIKGEKNTFKVLHGDLTDLEKTEYLLALDADTGTDFNAVQELVQVARHPFYEPRYDGSGKRIIGGYGILAPCLRPALAGEHATPFQRLLSGTGGISVYDCLLGERYQDWFGDSVFTGKGLIHVDAYHKVLDKAFPGESVLSHDILEGCSLRTGYVSDVQLTDGFPGGQTPWCRRYDRWVRGDWQNAAYIFKRSSLNALSRWKLADNLRRSLVPVAAAASLFASLILPNPAAVILVITAMLCGGAGEWLGCLRSLGSGGFGLLSRLYFSHALPAAMQAFLRGGAETVMTGEKAFFSLIAIARACFRVTVSKKNLLQWTTAAESEGRRGRGEKIRNILPSLLMGIVLCGLGGPWQRAAGLILLADIPFALWSCRPQKTKKEHILSQPDRERLISYAAAMWRYFEDFCNEENHYLPPDNFQESPVRVVARRTSPTNIGLMLLCALAARDLGFITDEELGRRLNQSLDSIEKLQKFHGNLLNWYSTVTLEPLQPFVSTVDSGNFLCCLTALRQGLKEYMPRCRELATAAERITVLIEQTDLRPLYHEGRGLFAIGADVNGKLSGNFYDLFMSEARMTAYYAVARRQVPAAHWGALGRILVGEGRYSGLVSWTGTCFEYFMPYLFIPAPEGSLCYESLRFCLWCQRRRSRQGVWGTSESGFYAFDSRLNYQYKAHGVPKLGLKRGLEKDAVMAPYASFLTLSMAPNASLRNLNRMREMGLFGKYGFYEAVDMTPGRCAKGEYAVVSSYMAHHIGMSMVGLLNLLQDNVMQRRFMADEAMAGAESLLNEHIPVGAGVFRDIKNRPVPKIHERTERKSNTVEQPSLQNPGGRLYSNGRWSMFITDSGAGVSTLNGMDMTVRSGDLLCRPRGIFAVFRTREKSVPFVSCLDREGKTAFKVRFSEHGAEHIAKNGEVLLRMQSAVLRGENGEARRFIVENGGRSALEGEVLLYTEPCLVNRKAFAAHPAFSKLFTQSEWDDESKILCFTRRRREGEEPVSLAVGLGEEEPVTAETDRQAVLLRGEDVFSLHKAKRPRSPHPTTDPCMAMCVPVHLRPREKKVFTLLLCAAQTPGEAKEQIQILRSRRNGERPASDPFYHCVLESALAERILPAVYYPETGACRSAVITGLPDFGKQDLWSFGISGDYPILLLYLGDESEITTALPYIRINKILRSCSAVTDLVIAFREEAGYRSPMADAVRRALKTEDCEMMLGVSGGVHAVNLNGHTPAQWAALKYSAVFDANVLDKQKKKEKAPILLQITQKSEQNTENRKNVRQFTFTEGEITVPSTDEFPLVPWGLVLCNPSFGTMVTDKALGFTWALNSRQNKLTPWQNDAISENRGELLVLRHNGTQTDMILGSKARFSPTEACWNGQKDGLSYRVNVFVPPRGNVKQIEVSITNRQVSEASFRVAYYVQPVMGVSADDISFMSASLIPEGAVFHNAFADIGGFGAVECEGGAHGVCLHREDFLAGRWRQSEAAPGEVTCVAVMREGKLSPGHSMTLRFSLSFGKTVDCARRIPALAGERPDSPPRVTIQSGWPGLDTFFNSFLYQQIQNARFFGRTGFYQCGGAYGFRDQLQDSLAFIYTQPHLTRTHILRCCHAQFEQGDVLHWWHVIPNKTAVMRGVRTRCSDDRLWLPYVLCRYVEMTGDYGILKVPVPYIEGELLQDGEAERCMDVSSSPRKGTVVQHALAAVECSLKFGKNGLPLIGSGDWNDGFNRLGIKGRGESVWLGMFLVMVLEKTAPLCSHCEKEEDGLRYRKIAEALRRTLETYAFDGEVFLRAVSDSGTVLGGKNASACRVDILTQAFASFAGIGTPDMRRTALKHAIEELTDKENRTVALLKPAFSEKAAEEVGYIASYPEGIRENAGQYTHAAVWLAAACYREGLTDWGDDLLRLILPNEICADEEGMERYRGEPYVLAGDVSTGKTAGRAGWSQYTGSAAWLYLTVIEEKLGVRMKNGILSAEPQTGECKDKILDENREKAKIRVEKRKNGFIISNSEK